MRALRPRSCDQARWYASLEADAELSQLERALLDAHARRCPACAAYRADVAAIAERVRGAALEPLPTPVTVRNGRRRRLVLVRVPTVTAAAAMLLVGVGTVLSARSTEHGAYFAAPQRHAYMSMTQLQREVALIPRAGSAEAEGLGGSSIAV